MSSEKMNIYLNFVVQALKGYNPDNLVQQYEKVIKEVATQLHNTSPIEPTELYRGILLEDEYVSEDNTLKPIKHIQFLSFSEDLKAAQTFADTESFISSYVMQIRPTSKGYIIKHKLSNPREEVLFHHSWIDLLHLRHPMFGLDPELLDEQKEVILKQNYIVYKLEKYK